MKYAALLLPILLGLAGTAASAQSLHASDAIGFWVEQDQGWVVETSPCADGNGLCGTLVSYRDDADMANVSLDVHNPDPSKRSMPLCGIQLLGAFTPVKGREVEWEHGWVYAPDTGKTYTGEAKMIDMNTIKLRGFIFISLFGRTLTLTREVGTVVRCSAYSGNNVGR
jgi:uncharacterized protein (DUF2147 family)